jgi:hypothetical protein
MCPDEVSALMKQVLREHHKLLHDAAVTVLCMFADAGEDEEGRPVPAVKLHGVPCAATVRKTSARDRACGMADAVITIDKRIWYTIGDPARLALLDHELEHLAVDFDEDGSLRLDTSERPVVKIRLHDWELHGFENVVERHGLAAIESLSLRDFFNTPAGQLVFGFIRTKKERAA